MSLVAAISRALSDGDELVIVIDGTDEIRANDVRRHLRRTGVRAEVVAYNYPAGAVTDLNKDLVAAAGTLRAQLFRSLAPDVVLITSFFEWGSNYTTELDEYVMAGIKAAVIAYDVIPLLYPERYLKPGEFTDWYLKKVEKFKKFDLFFAISQATRQDLVEHLQVDPARITVIDAGWDDSLAASASNDEMDRLSPLGIDKPFVLMVGNADWRKNCLGVLRAFSDLPEAVSKQHQLVFTQVGQDVRDALQNEYSHLRDRVILAGKVDESTLAQLYGRCRVFFFPSLYEGFGLPVLEAMAFNAPILSSSLGALREVVHDQRVLFDPNDRVQSGQMLRRALEDDEFRLVLRDGARERALEFTWERCAGLLLESLRDSALADTDECDWSAWNPQLVDIQRFAKAIMNADANSAAGLKFGLEAIAMRGRRRILVDITEVVRLDARSGIQRVVRNYMIGLFGAAQVSGTCQVEPIYWNEDGIQYARSYARERLGLDCEGADDLVEVLANDLLFMVDSSWWSLQRFDGLHRQVRRAGGEVVWMVYDLVPINVPQYCDPGMPPLFSGWLEHVFATADGCICISEATRQDLEHFFDERREKSVHRPWTRSLHLGSDLESGRVSRAGEEVVELIEQLSAAGFFVALSTVEPRKDYATVLDAFESLWRDGGEAALVIIGKQGWNIEALADRIREHPQMGLRLFWLEGASDGDVAALLSKATALIQASAAEGFGLPVVEAGSLGIPLILSDLDVFREIAGDEAVYFPVGDAGALATVLATGVASGQWLRPTGIRTMTWAESSRKLLDLLLR